MADQKPLPGRKKPSETLRQKAERAATPRQPRGRRLRSAGGTISRPFKAAHRIGKKEYYLPMPDNRVGRFLNKRRHFVPTYFKEAWAELRQVEWPSGRTTIRLTLAVFIFSIVFGVIVTVVDFGLDKVFRKVFIE